MSTTPPPNPVDLDNLLNNMSELDPLAADLAKRTKTWLVSTGVTPLVAGIIGGSIGAVLGLALGLIGLLITIVVMIGDPIIRVFLRVLTKVRTDTVPEQIDISASVLSEFLATEISPEHLRTGKTGDATIDAARAIGGALLDRLTKEFAPNGVVTPDSGEKAAQAFAGYGVNFAVQNTMIGTLADALSFHLLEDFRELGVEVAQNLGLGRLVRQALQPLVRNTISEPFDQQLRKRYRPDQLSETDAIQAFFGEFITSDQLQEIFARKGYSDLFITTLVQLRKPTWTDADVSTLMRNGLMPDAEAIGNKRGQGWSDFDSKRQLQLTDLKRAEPAITSYRDLIRKQRIDQLLDQDTYNKLLDALPLSDLEKQWERNLVGQTLEIPRAFLTRAELKAAFLQGLVDFDYVDTWFSRLGMSADDENLEEFLFLIELNKFTDAQQAKADKAARTAAAAAAKVPNS